MNLKKLRNRAISLLAIVLPMVITFLTIADPVLAQRSDRQLKENIADVDLDAVLASVI